MNKTEAASLLPDLFAAPAEAAAPVEEAAESQEGQ
jgi:hypothetical protein